MNVVIARWIQLSRGHEVRWIIGCLAATAAVTRLILQRRRVGDDGVAGDAGVVGHRSVGIFVQTEATESCRVVKRQIH